MTRSLYCYFAALCLFCVACSGENEEVANSVIPTPYKMEVGSGSFDYEAPLVWFDGVETRDAESLIDFVKKMYPKSQITYSEEKKGIIKIIYNKESNIVTDSYILKVTSDAIEVYSSNYGGMVYGIMTLIQLYNLNDGEIPELYINDMPIFNHRGVLFDVANNFFDLRFIKKQLGLMAFYKFNRMLFHFNDEGGWRVEINAYPKLTDYGAWRPYPNWKEWSTGNRNFCTATDPNATGGFYTKSQLKELTEYANKLNITVIPEINLPRHADAIIAAYPSLSCPAYRGNDKLLCMGNEETYKFLEGVLSELMEMFPAEYMHIGCSDIVDYNPAECPICKERMRSERLSDKEGLKGYFINRIAKFVEKKGRKVICWADAIDDKIPESAWLMSSSRSSINTDKALKMGHNVIMSPDSTCLFSTYQDNLQSELGANDCLSIEKTYDYYPVADGVTSVERDNVGGTEGRLYTQMISTTSFAEYMLYPRLLALSEVAWSMPENKSWKRFIVALNKHYKFLKAENVNARPLSKEVTVKENVNLDKKCIEITFSCNMIPSQIHYTFDGGEPTNNSPEYKSPLSVVDSAVIKFAVFDNGKKVSDTQTFKSYYHKAIGKNVIYRKPYSAYYPANSKTTLTDGYTGGFCSANNCWQGFLGDLDVVVDLGETTSIKEITAQFVRMPDNGIHYPDWVKISISEDGKNYRLIKHIVNNFPCDIPGIDYKNFSFMGNISARYINYQAFRYGDAKDHILTDEIIVK